MLANYKIGRYYVADSCIHKLNPIYKILSILLVVISIILIDNNNKLLFIGIFIITVILLSKIDINIFLKNIYKLKVLLLFILIINLLFKVDINTTIINLFKIVYIVLYTSILNLTTTISETSYAITKILNPFSKIIPANKISLSISLALRFIPTIMNEGNRIIKAQIVRGRDLNNENILGKIEIIATMIVPMIILSFKRADILSDVMGIRLYNKKKVRSYYHKKRITMMDIFLLLISIQLLIITILK